MFVGSADGAHRAQDAERHRQIETRAFLADVGRRQVDGDGFVRITEAGIEQRGLDALAALAHGRIGHADRDEIARVAAGIHVHLDVDQVRFDSKDSRAAGPEKGH